MNLYPIKICLFDVRIENSKPFTSLLKNETNFWWKKWFPRLKIINDFVERPYFAVLRACDSLP